MIEAPTTIVRSDFQTAWIDAVKLLADNGWERRNLTVHIEKPKVIDADLHRRVGEFCEEHGLLGAKHVAYTIFPHRLYAKKGKASTLFHAYNRERGLYDRVKTSWGTYFRRMTRYEGRDGAENQLENIISAVNDREQMLRAAYTIVIQHPGSETVRPQGGPCLNYAAVQLEPGQRRTLGLLAVYRNHDFVERAYGNYWGLCNLIRFLAKETRSRPGPLTCVSSHAYVDKHKKALRCFVDAL